MAIQVKARYGEGTDRLLLRFKRLCVRGGVFKEIKRRRCYEKPSDRRRRLAKESIRRINKAERKAQRDRQRRKRA